MSSQLVLLRRIATACVERGTQCGRVCAVSFMWGSSDENLGLPPSLPPIFRAQKMTQDRSRAAKWSIQSHFGGSWCPGEDSNLHELLHWYLKPARLPVPPPGQDGSAYARRRNLRTAPILVNSYGMGAWLWGWVESGTGSLARPVKCHPAPAKLITSGRNLIGNTL